MKRVKFFGRLSLVLLIFFALQGEVVQRYVDLFQGKLEHRSAVPKKTAERQLLIKLQCYTQKFLPIALPPDINFNHPVFFKPVAKLRCDIFKEQLYDVPDPGYISLRGPPPVLS